MTPFDVRLAFRLNRFELLALGLVIGCVAVAALVVAGNLDATGYGVACLTLGPDEPMPRSCEAAGRAFYDIQNSQASIVQSLLIVLPFLLAVLVGVPLVARELERGTSRLAWSLAPSRTHWFLTRLVPALLAVFVLSLVAGLALDRLTGATEPTADPFRSFAGFGGRGVVLAARAIFILAVGVAIGSVVGRAPAGPDPHGRDRRHRPVGWQQRPQPDPRIGGGDLRRRRRRRATRGPVHRSADPDARWRHRDLDQLNVLGPAAG